MTLLVTVAHGTRTPRDGDAARDITAHAAARLRMSARTAFIELAHPLFTEVLAEAHQPVIAVPLLFSTGFHMRQDLPEMAAKSPVPVRLGPPLGPDPLLAAAQVARLEEVGARPGQRVVLVAAGSSDEAATHDQLGAVALLARAWDGPVMLATLSGRGERPADVVRPGDAVSPYLLSPGSFHDRIVEEVGAVAPGAPVADVLGAHECVVDLVCQRAQVLL